MKIMRIATTIAFMLLGLNACGGARSVAPTPDNDGSNASQVVGVVGNSITGPAIGAQVTVLDGPLAGETTFTGVDGVFRLPWNFRSDGHLQFSKDGFAPLTLSMPGVQPRGVMPINLHLAAAPVGLGGIYTITFTADSACAQIPNALRTRSYVATIAQPAQFPQNTRFDVELSGALFAAGTLRGALNSFYGFTEANLVKLNILNAAESIEIEEGIAEQFAPGALLEIYGSGETLTVTDPTRLSTTLSGYFAVTDASGTRKCTSSRHLIVMTRRT